MNQPNGNADAKLKQELLEFLQDLPVMPDNFKSKQSEFWGRQHTETLFRRMLHDREFLQLLIWESIAPKTVDLSNFCCLFSRYTCFKFFERYAGVPFWFCCHLMGIPEEEMICFFAVADLRHIFGCKIAQNLFDQLKTCRPNFNLRDFNDLCVKFNRDHCESRREKLRSDVQLEICKQNLIHFDVNSRRDYGMTEYQTSSITYVDPILETENTNIDTTENDDMDLSQQLAECFKNELEEEDDDEDAAPAISDVKREIESPPADWRLENLRKARESKAAKRKLSTTCTKNNPVIEMPAFSVQDLEKFTDEDPYVSNALAFACCDHRLARMTRVKNILERELGTTPKKLKTDTGNQSAVAKLRQLACFFAPKNSEFDAQQIRNMSSDQLSNLNFNNFAKSCEIEFAKIIEESKRNLREKFQMQIARYQRLLMRMANAYQPENKVARRGETLNILSFEREINKHLREREEKHAAKVDYFVDLNENIVDIKNEEFVESNTVVVANTEHENL